MSFPPVDCEQQKRPQVKNRPTLLIVLPSCPVFPPASPLYHTIAYFLWFTLFLAHFLHLLPAEGWEPPRQSIWVAHLISQTVSPRLPQQSIPAVVEAVRPGKFFPRVLDVSSLSPDHSQEGQLAQVHLNTISPKLLYSFRSQQNYYFFLNTPIQQQQQQ